jgi:hypothetical protein
VPSHCGSAGTSSTATTQWPNIRFDRKRVHIGEAHFVSEYEMTATQEGREIVCDGVDVFTIEGGRVARKDSYLDLAAIQPQLGELASTSA